MIAAALGLLVAMHAPGISGLRAENNVAIERHDATKLSSIWAPHFVLVSGDGTVWPDPSKLLRSYETVEFKDPGFIEYNRTPDAIVVSSDGRRAAERGRWIAVRRDGRPSRSGVYMASWIKTPQGWKIQWESYITLDQGVKRK